MKKSNRSKAANEPAEVKLEGAQNEVAKAEELVEPPTEGTKEEAAKTKIGVVTDCLKLNVRKEPRSNAPVICEIKKLTEVVVDEKGSTGLFYKIHTAAGVEGFCMKKYLAVRP